MLPSPLFVILEEKVAGYSQRKMASLVEQLAMSLRYAGIDGSNVWTVLVAVSRDSLLPTAHNPAK